VLGASGWPSQYAFAFCSVKRIFRVASFDWSQFRYRSRLIFVGSFQSRANWVSFSFSDIVHLAISM